MSLCRALGYSYSTFLARKYLHRKPRLEEVILTVWWYKHGKPVRFRKHKYTMSFLDLLDKQNKEDEY